MTDRALKINWRIAMADMVAAGPNAIAHAFLGVDRHAACGKHNRLRAIWLIASDKDAKCPACCWCIKNNLVGEDT